MKVLLTDIDGTGNVYDVSFIVKANNRITLAEELERLTFQRVVDDVQVEVTNLRKWATNTWVAGIQAARQSTTTLYPYGHAASTMRWRLEIYSDANRRLFDGLLDNMLTEWDLKEENIKFSAFSKTKSFWDKAKATRIIVPYPPNVLGYPAMDSFWNFKLNSAPYCFLGDVLSYQIAWGFGNGWTDPGTGITYDITDGGVIFQGLSTDTIDINPDNASDLAYLHPELYYVRPIRSCADSTVTGNEGKLSLLFPDTTWEDFFTALALNYNAEFFVDPTTMKLTMRRRQSVLNDSGIRASTVIKNPKDIRVLILDEQKYDWVHVGAIGIVNPPTFNYATDVQIIKGTDFSNQRNGVVGPTSYVILDTVSGGWPNITSFKSLPTEFSLGLTNQQRDNGYTGYQVKLHMPPKSATIAGRGIFRLCTDGQWHALPFVGALPGMLPTDIDPFRYFIDTYTDSYVRTMQTMPTGFRNWAKQWLRFDENRSQWAVPIIDSGAVASPFGSVLDIQPELHFSAAPLSGDLTQDDPWDVFSFFGREMDGTHPEVLSYWQRLFLSRRIIRCTFKGVDYRIGDTVHFDIPNLALVPGASDYFLIRAARIDMIAEETEMELIEI